MCLLCMRSMQLCRREYKYDGLSGLKIYLIFLIVILNPGRIDEPCHWLPTEWTSRAAASSATPLLLPAAAAVASCSFDQVFVTTCTQSVTAVFDD